MGRVLRGAIVTLFGLATTLLTAFGLVYLELRYDFSLYGLVYGFIIPFGAIFSGILAASGYFIGSRLLSYRPGRSMLATILVVSGGNFFFIYWLEYRLSTVNGEFVRNWMTFSEYLKYVLTHTAITTGGEGLPFDKFELGIGGYLYAALLIFGFALGGLFVYLLVRSAPYCDACGLYMKKYGSQTRYFVRHEELADCAAAFQAEMKLGRFRGAMELHGGRGVRTADEATGYSLRTEIRQCNRCGNQWVSLIAKQRTNKKWQALPKIQYSAYCTERVDVVEQLAS